MGRKITLDELQAEMRAKAQASYDDPANVARREDAARRRRDQIDAEIAAGLRDEAGELLVECGNDCPTPDACKRADTCLSQEAADAESDDAEDEEF